MKTTPSTKPLSIRTGVKSGGFGWNHNQSRKVKVRTGVKSGGFGWNHNQSRA